LRDNFQLKKVSCIKTKLPAMSSRLIIFSKRMVSEPEKHECLNKDLQETGLTPHSRIDIDNNPRALKLLELIQ
jgi:hypothetical protein